MMKIVHKARRSGFTKELVEHIVHLFSYPKTNNVFVGADVNVTRLMKMLSEKGVNGKVKRRLNNDRVLIGYEIIKSKS